MPEGVTAKPIKPATQMLAEMEGQSTPDAPIADIDPRTQREYKFEFEYTLSNGRTLSGPFTNRILNVEERIKVGVLRANICGQVPVDALDGATQDHAEMLAHMTVSLIDRPDWAKELGHLTDENLLSLIYAEVALHEARFRGSGEDQGKGKGDSNKQQGAPES